MAKKSTKKTLKPVRPQLGDGVEILNAGSVLEDPITRTLETNYMPYAMSVIVSRALPEIDGFKPAHRKLLYTMYEMGLLKGARTKSANIVGSTMHLNPHGDAAIYDTMVRMGRGNESLLVPFVDSKGNFGKAYSRDMSCAAARYTEAKLESVCEELFRDIDKETVDFVPNYDSTTTEPTLLPVTFPTILANNTLGIAVGMACNICSFNLAELCATTVALMKDEHHDIGTTMPAPDFVGGGQIVYDEAQMREIYENGRGSVKVRARYNAVPGENMIEVTQIPPTTTVEAIMDKIAELVKTGKVKEISDMRDETDLNGLKLTLDLKRGVDADKLMAKLFKATPLEDSFSCNFNILVSGQPRVMGVREILKEWTAFRVECVRRRTYYDLHGKEKRLHLLQGLAAILLDIDKAIRIIRTTEEETEVVPNLMIGFGIDEVQADYVAEIKLRHLNREYILKRTGEIEQLEKDIADLNDVLAKPARIRRIIINELNDVAKKYGQPRRSEILYDLPEEDGSAEEEATRLINEAIRNGENRKKEMLLEAKDEIHKSRTENDREVKERRAELTKQERRLEQKETTLDRKTEAFEKKEEELNRRMTPLAQTQSEAEELKAKQLETLEQLSGLTQDQAKEYLLQSIENDVRHEAAMKIKEIEQQLKDEAEEKGREIIATAIQRCAADHAAETTVSVVPCPTMR